MRTLLCFATVLMLAIAAMSQQAPSKPDWKPLAFLLGNWNSGEGQGAPGKANAGGAKFTLELDNEVMVRRAFSEYPASEGKPATHHEDLMIIHPDNANGFAAEYYDSEGHIIHYQVAVDEPGSKVTLLSHAAATMPGFRLTYRKNSEKLDGTFEISPPGTTDRFSEYLRWSSSKTR